MAANVGRAKPDLTRRSWGWSKEVVGRVLLDLTRRSCGSSKEVVCRMGCLPSTTVYLDGWAKGFSIFECRLNGRSSRSIFARPYGRTLFGWRSQAPRLKPRAASRRSRQVSVELCSTLRAETSAGQPFGLTLHDEAELRPTRLGQGRGGLDFRLSIAEWRLNGRRSRSSFTRPYATKRSFIQKSPILRAEHRSARAGNRLARGVSLEPFDGPQDEPFDVLRTSTRGETGRFLGRKWCGCVGGIGRMGPFSSVFAKRVRAGSWGILGRL